MQHPEISIHRDKLLFSYVKVHGNIKRSRLFSISQDSCDTSRPLFLTFYFSKLTFESCVEFSEERRKKNRWELFQKVKSGKTFHWLSKSQPIAGKGRLYKPICKEIIPWKRWYSDMSTSFCSIISYCFLLASKLYFIVLYNFIEMKDSKYSDWLIFFPLTDLQQYLKE